MDKFTVLDLLQLDLKEHDALNLKCIAGRPGLVREITVPELNRPGLALSGFFDNFAEQRLQIFGRGENAFLTKLEQDRRLDTIQRIFTYSLPCCVFTHHLDPTPYFLSRAEEMPAGRPLPRFDAVVVKDVAHEAPRPAQGYSGPEGERR